MHPRPPLAFAFAAALLAAAIPSRGTGQEPTDTARVALTAAFAPATAAPGSEVVLEVQAAIATGYHVYGGKDKSATRLEITAAGGLEAIGKPEVPDGKEHATLGLKSYWLDGTATLRQRFRVPAGAAAKIDVAGKVAYTACTPEFCEPAATAAFSATLAVTAPQAAGQKEAAGQKGDEGREFCGPDDKARVRVRLVGEPPAPGGTATIELTVTVDKGWHAYGTKETTNMPVSVSVGSDTVQADGKPEIPPGESHVNAGTEQFPLPSQFQIVQRVRVAEKAAGKATVKGTFTYQVCNHSSCLPPLDIPFAIDLPLAAPAKQDPAPAPAPAPAGGKVFGSDEDKVKVRVQVEPAHAAPGGTIVVTLTATVEDGWHAYGTKEGTNIPVSVAFTDTAGLQALGKPEIPPGDRHMLGDLEQFPLPPQFEVAQKLRVPADAKGPVTLQGTFSYQVCNASGCLPPMDIPFTVDVPLAAGPAPSTTPQVAQQPAGQSPEAAAPQAPTGAKTYHGPTGKVHFTARFDPPRAAPGQGSKLLVEVQVDPPYHLYGTLEKTNQQVGLDLAPATGLQTVGGIEVPPGELHELLGIPTFPLPPEFTIGQGYRVEPTATGTLTVSGKLLYQYCDESMCYEGESVPFTATLAVDAAAPPSAVAAGKTDAGGVPAPGGSLWGLLLACIAGGLFALAMPCTYPMIPITFSFFTKQAEKRGGNVLPLALTYGFGIVGMFVLTGVVFSAVIVDIANHWVTNSIIAAVFLLFAAALFGWINLQPPAFLQHASGRASRAGGYSGVFFMGATLVITSFTCTGPIVGAMLANIAVYGKGVVALGMATFGATMAAPFVALSLMPGRVKELPRSGDWMETVKVSLGFLELAMTLKFVSMVDVARDWQWLSRELFLLFWAVIFGLWALYLFGILRKAGTPNDGVGGGRMATGIAVSLAAAYFLFGALGYQLDYLTTGFAPPYSSPMVATRTAAATPGAGARNGSGEGEFAAHVLVVDDGAKALQLAKADDKLLLYNYTGFN